MAGIGTWSTIYQLNDKLDHRECGHHKPPALLAERISSTTAPHVTTLSWCTLNGCVCKCSVVRWKCSGAPRPLRVVLRQVAILPAAVASVLSVRNGMPQFDIQAKSDVHFLHSSFACITSKFKDNHFITPEKTEKKKIMSEKTFLLTGRSVEEIRRQVLARWRNLETD